MFRDAFPILYVEDVERSIRFYSECFGFELGYRWPDEGPPEYAFLRLAPLGIGLATTAAGERGHGQPTAAGGAAHFELCVYCDDADAAAERLRAWGARELRAPQDESWGERRAYFEDPDGNPLHVTARIGEAT